MWSKKQARFLAVLTGWVSIIFHPATHQDYGHWYYQFELVLKLLKGQSKCSHQEFCLFQYKIFIMITNIIGAVAAFVATAYRVRHWLQQPQQIYKQTDWDFLRSHFWFSFSTWFRKKMQGHARFNFRSNFAQRINFK